MATRPSTMNQFAPYFNKNDGATPGHVRAVSHPGPASFMRRGRSPVDSNGGHHGGAKPRSNTEGTTTGVSDRSGDATDSTGGAVGGATLNALDYQQRPVWPTGWDFYGSVFTDLVRHYNHEIPPLLIPTICATTSHTLQPLCAPTPTAPPNRLLPCRS